MSKRGDEVSKLLSLSCDARSAVMQSAGLMLGIWSGCRCYAKIKKPCRDGAAKSRSERVFREGLAVKSIGSCNPNADPVFLQVDENTIKLWRSAIGDARRSNANTA